MNKPPLLILSGPGEWVDLNGKPFPNPQVRPSPVHHENQGPKVQRDHRGHPISSPPNQIHLSRKEHIQAFETLLKKARSVAGLWDESVFRPLLKNLLDHGRRIGKSRRELREIKNELGQNFVHGQLDGLGKFYETHGTSGSDPLGEILRNQEVKNLRKWATEFGMDPKEFAKELSSLVEKARQANGRKAKQELNRGMQVFFNGLCQGIIHLDPEKFYDGLDQGFRHWHESLRFYLASNL